VAAALTSSTMTRPRNSDSMCAASGMSSAMSCSLQALSHSGDLIVVELQDAHSSINRSRHEAVPLASPSATAHLALATKHAPGRPVKDARLDRGEQACEAQRKLLAREGRRDQAGQQHGGQLTLAPPPVHGELHCLRVRAARPRVGKPFLWK